MVENGSVGFPLDKLCRVGVIEVAVSKEDVANIDRANGLGKLRGESTRVHHCRLLPSREKIAVGSEWPHYELPDVHRSSSGMALATVNT
jgi:hypothetical protein